MKGIDGEHVTMLSEHDLRNAAASIYGCAITLLDSERRLPEGTRTELLNVIIAQSEWIGRVVVEPE